MQGQGCARYRTQIRLQVLCHQELRLHSLCICDLELPATEAGPGSVK